MRWLTPLIPALLTTLGLAPSPLQAEGWLVRVTVTEEWIDESDPRFGDDAPVDTYFVANGVDRDAPPPAPRISYVFADRAITSFRASAPTALAAFGPFRVIDPTRAALVGVTDAATPAQFDALLRAYPQMRTLDLVEAPGTENDRANLAVGRMIRAAGLTTRVPRGGSVRSGAVELFLAGERREVADGARFAVHSWRDNRGREADDFAPDAPEHRYYLDYYREMGMSDEGARDFYAMTNAVPHARARWLDAGAMRGWIARTAAQAANDNEAAGEADAPPRIAYLDVTATSP
ncbi:alpha/beta hydrolase [Alteriqipengyuania sp. 357]